MTIDHWKSNRSIDTNRCQLVNCYQLLSACNTTYVSSACGHVLLPGSSATAFAREMSRAILTIYQVVVKGYHEGPFAIEIDEQFIAQKKRGDRSHVLKVIDDHDQLGHLKRELFAP